MDGFSLSRDLDDALDHVSGCVNDMFVLGRKKADAERAYRIQKQKRILFERQKGTPVSIIGDIVKGYKDIADLAFERDCAVTEYDANYEAILYWKKRVDSLREKLNREWSKEGDCE